MTMVSILEALADTAPATAGRRCKVGRWLDGLAGQEGHDDLVAMFETPASEKGRRPAHGRSLPQLCAIASRLGMPTSDKSVSEHRNGVCRCTW